MHEHESSQCVAPASAVVPAFLLHRHPITKLNFFFSPRKAFYFPSQREKQKMVRANGGPTISLPITLCGALSPLTQSCPFSMQAKNQGGRKFASGSVWGDKKGQQLKRRAFWFYPACTANNHHGRAKLPRSMIERARVRGAGQICYGDIAIFTGQ